MPEKTQNKSAAPTTLWGLLLVTAVATGFVYWNAYSTRPHEPVQPLPFSHTSHTAADKAGMDCRACHAAAQHAAGAGFPAATTCLDCHRHILSGDARLLPLHSAANPNHPAYTGEPLRWVRKAPLPDTIAFHHGQHASAGISCEQCHAHPDAQPPHTMSSCLDCHRREAVPTNCDRCHR